MASQMPNPRQKARCCLRPNLRTSESNTANAASNRLSGRAQAASPNRIHASDDLQPVRNLK